MVDHALEQLLETKAALRIVEVREEVALPDDTEPEDVFMEIQRVARRLDAMLINKFTPADVFQQVSRSVNYSESLLSQFPGTTPRPAPPSFERRKRPPDVYGRLRGCFDTLRELASVSGIQILDIDTDSVHEQATPSDVHDLAAIITAELAYIHDAVPGVPPVVEPEYPGRKTPSDVYQQVGVLEMQIEQLSAHVERTPRWMRR